MRCWETKWEKSLYLDTRVSLLLGQTGHISPMRHCQQHLTFYCQTCVSTKGFVCVGEWEKKVEERINEVKHTFGLFFSHLSKRNVFALSVMEALVLTISLPPPAKWQTGCGAHSYLLEALICLPLLLYFLPWLFTQLCFENIFPMKEHVIQSTAKKGE